jgi:hypothetical protein
LAKGADVAYPTTTVKLPDGIAMAPSQDL